MTAMEQVKQLEQYLAVAATPEDPVLVRVLSKLLNRELLRVRALKATLLSQLALFEKAHALDSPTFYAQYEKGAMGDAMDFVEWAATWEMPLNLDLNMYLSGAAASFLKNTAFTGKITPAT